MPAMTLESRVPRIQLQRWQRRLLHLSDKNGSHHKCLIEVITVKRQVGGEGISLERRGTVTRPDETYKFETSEDGQEEGNVR